MSRTDYAQAIRLLDQAASILDEAYEAHCRDTQREVA